MSRVAVSIVDGVIRPHVATLELAGPINRLNIYSCRCLRFTMGCPLHRRCQLYSFTSIVLCAASSATTRCKRWGGTFCYGDVAVCCVHRLDAVKRVVSNNRCIPSWLRSNCTVVRSGCSCQKDGRGGLHDVGVSGAEWSPSTSRDTVQRWCFTQLLLTTLLRPEKRLQPAGGLGGIQISQSSGESSLPPSLNLL